jgi:hypothetical protein
MREPITRHAGPRTFTRVGRCRDSAPRGEENYLAFAPEEGAKVTSRAKCPPKTKLTGGGARTIPTAATEADREGAKGTIEISRPDYNGSNEWVAALVVTSNKKGTIGVQAYAVCAK